MQFKNLLKRYPFLNYSVAAIILDLVVLVLVFSVQPLLPPEVPLFYGMPESSAQLSGSIYLTVPSLAALLIAIVNSLIAVAIKNDFLNKTLTISSFVVGIFGAITTIRIILLVSTL